MVLSWLNDGIDRTHFTVSISNLAADSKMMSWSAWVAAVDVLAKLWSVKISSELLTSSSLPLPSLLCCGKFGNVPGIWNKLARKMCDSFLGGAVALKAFGAWNACETVLSGGSIDGSVAAVSEGIIGGGGGGGGGANRFPFAAAKCRESNTFGWNALKCE